MSVPFAKRVAYRENARVLGRRWRDYLQLIVGVAVAVAVVALTPFMPVRQFMMGLVVGGAVTLATLSAMRLHDPRVNGHLAEEFSLESLRKVRGWIVIDNVPFERSDVDHAVVTPSGVLAVESKHRGRLASAAAEQDRLRRDCAATAEAARKLRSLLRSRKLHDAAPVTPVLMVWGPGAPELPDGYAVVDGVHVVAAEYPRLWQHLFAAPVVPFATRARIGDEMQAFVRMRAGHDDARSGRLRGELWNQLRTGVREERAARAARRTQIADRRRRHLPPARRPLEANPDRGG